MRFRKAGAWIIITVMMMTVCACAGSGTEDAGEASLADTVEKKEPEIIVIDKTDYAEAAKKTETVKVKADAAGAAEKITVETLLENTADSASLIDCTGLSDIRNMEGDEEFETDGDILYWQNAGSNITYKGTGTQELPVNVKVTYYLDGKEMQPSEMAGAAGEVRIRFDYENLTYKKVKAGGEKVKTPVPFAAVSMVPMPDDVFSNIEISNGSVISFSGENIAVGYAFAGVKEFLGDDADSLGMDVDNYLEITAKTDDFELEFTETILTTGFFEDTDTDSLDDLQDVYDAVGELKDLAKEMSDAVTELSDGTDEFKEYLDEYVSGAAELADGTVALKDGLWELYSNTGLSDGAGSLKNGITGLKETVQQYQKADKSTENQQLYAALIAGLEQLETGADGLVSGADAYREAVGSAYYGAETLSDGAYEFSDAGTKLTDGFTEVSDGVGEFKDAVDKFEEEGVSKMEEEAGEDPHDYIVKVKALKKADRKYVTYGGVRDGVESEVRFLIETEEIKK